MAHSSYEAPKYVVQWRSLGVTWGGGVRGYSEGG